MATSGDQPRRRGLPWRRSGRRSFWRELPVLALIAVLVAVLIRTFVMQTFFIPSGSMESTLLVDDRVLVNKVVYDFREPHRGEIVVFQPPASWRIDPTEEDFIKRVVGLPGDTVACVRDPAQRGSNTETFVGKVAVNGRAVDETYINADSPACNQAFEVEVPAGRLFVLGDHRRASGDSRVHLADPDSPNGTISVSDVVGRAEAIYWPVNRWRFLGTPEAFDKVPDPDGR